MGCLTVILIIIGLVILFTNPGLFVGLAVFFGFIWLAVRSSKKTSSEYTSNQSYKQTYPKITVSYQTSFENSLSDSSKMHWQGKGTSITVSNYIILDPLTYYSESNLRYPDASCIQANLPVGRPVFEERGSLGYWPEYSRMTPNQRANYLNWLASGKKEPMDDIGYVFIYFYGLERRALIDKADIPEIIEEVTRLLNIYTFSNSFNGYAHRFIAFVTAQTNDSNIIKSMIDKSMNFDNLGLSLVLAWLYKNNQVLPADLAFEVAKNDIRSPRSVIVDRVEEQFKTLFARKYNQLFGDGMKLKIASRERVIDYGSASPTLLNYRSSSKAIQPIHIPDVLGIQSQFKPLVQIWTECIEELRPLSREVAKGTKAGTREVYHALPEVLKAEADHPDKEKWEKVIADHAKENGVALLNISKLNKIQGFEPRPKLTFKQSEDLSVTANEVGFLLVPDARITCRAYGWDDIVAVIRPIDKTSLPKDDAYHSASLMLELGVAIASADGKVDNDEINFIVQTLESQFTLEPADTRRLEAYREVLIYQPPSLSSLTKRLATVLNNTQKETIGKFLIGVSAANGVVHKKEISLIQKTYTALGLDSNNVETIIENIIGTQPVEIQRNRSAKGEAIPSRSNQEHIPVVLNDQLLKQILADTAEVSQIIGKALCDVEAAVVDEVNISNQTSSPSTTPDLNIKISKELLINLDNRYHMALADLIQRETWLKDDIDALARKYGLMPSNLLDTINTWADEFLGDFLIEEGEPYKVNKRLLED